MALEGSAAAPVRAAFERLALEANSVAAESDGGPGGLGGAASDGDAVGDGGRGGTGGVDPGFTTAVTVSAGRLSPAMTATGEARMDVPRSA